MRQVAVILFLFICGQHSVLGQSNPKLALGIGVNTNGFYLHGQKMRNSNAESWKKPQGPAFEFGNIMHNKEVALLNNAFPGTSIYKLGKINYTWALRTSYQWRKPITYRTDKKAIAMNGIGGAGVSLAYAWPVYIRYFSSAPDNGGVEIVRYDPNVHSQALIYGRQSWTSHFGQGKFIPGLVFKTGLEFIWGSYFNNIKVIETGLRAEIFPNRLPIMYKNNLNKNVFAGVYFNFAFGSAD